MGCASKQSEQSLQSDKSRRRGWRAGAAQGPQEPPPLPRRPTSCLFCLSSCNSRTPPRQSLAYPSPLTLFACLARFALTPLTVRLLATRRPRPWRSTLSETKSAYGRLFRLPTSGGCPTCPPPAGSPLPNVWGFLQELFSRVRMGFPPAVPDLSAGHRADPRFPITDPQPSHTSCLFYLPACDSRPPSPVARLSFATHFLRLPRFLRTIRAHPPYRPLACKAPPTAVTLHARTLARSTAVPGPWPPAPGPHGGRALAHRPEQNDGGSR
jgi:hypothetical protein